MDSVASLYGRNHLGELISEISKNIFVPLTVGGGIRSVSDANHVFRSGADKVAINTAAVLYPPLITEISEIYGRQAMVLSIEAKFNGVMWEVYTHNGREKTGIDVFDWLEKGISLGAGEVLLTSIDRDGVQKGADLELMRLACERVDVPIIASGGIGCEKDVLDLINYSNIDAVAIASAFHYKKIDLLKLKTSISDDGSEVRIP
jgi:cyclase